MRHPRARYGTAGTKISNHVTDEDPPLRPAIMAAAPNSQRPGQHRAARRHHAEASHARAGKPAPSAPKDCQTTGARCKRAIHPALHQEAPEDPTAPQGTRQVTLPTTSGSCSRHCQMPIYMPSH
ncbi:hypothetical protein CSOJ01_11487 [Colletotrichum sojae]|uniref:Uncharacterized protein n=1 Tax=Colletotrichum sojae TaxID=2175907 RepID=A0A8H6IX86_9PEZI|nr:hypothetical protein CSOJ01_11487 [Colletotrichum sojae]